MKMPILIWVFVVFAHSVRSECRKGDFERFMISGDGHYEIKQELAEMFVEITAQDIYGIRTDPINKGNQWRKNPIYTYATQLGLGINAGANPANPTIEMAAHHMIPWPVITEKLKEMGDAIRKITNKNQQNKLYNKLRQGLQNMLRKGNSDYKKSTWQAAIEIEKDNIDTQCGQGGKLLKSAIQDVAYKLTNLIRWTPNNLFVGPKGTVRANDPGDNGDLLDKEILDSLSDGQRKKYPFRTITVTVDGVNIDQYEFPATGVFSYEERSWKTMIEVLVEIDSGPAFLGPMWEQDKKDKWILKRKVENKICYPDSVTKVNENMCPQLQGSPLDNTPFIHVTSGDIYCYNYPDLKTSSRSLCA